MDECYAVKNFQFLGKDVTYICQNSNGPCPLLAIANVLILRGHLSIKSLITEDGVISAQQLMHAVLQRLHETNPPIPETNELAHLTQKKTLQDVTELLPSLLVGLDVNVRFHNITDFEYTVACAVFDMLDIALVHGWLLDQQDEKTQRVVGNKSYNELIERLVDYRAVLMTESTTDPSPSADEPPNNFVSTTINDAKALQTPLPSQQEPLGIEDQLKTLRIDVNGIAESAESMPPAKKSPSKQTVQTLMKERQISDEAAVDKATALLEEGPILEEFFNSTASQLTYYGLVKLHEEVRERQLCVFFRNNHFSTLFKYNGALYLLVTDAGYLDEPTVVWELLNEIDGDTEYLDSVFRPLNASETKQQTILTQQEVENQRKREADQHNSNSETTKSDAITSNEASPQQDQCVGRNLSEDQDYLLALRLQQEEEGRVAGQKVASPVVASQRLQPIGADRDANHTFNVDDSSSNGDPGTSGAVAPGASEHGATEAVNENEFIPMVIDGQIIITEEELEAQRQAERFYHERKRQIETENFQLQQQIPHQQPAANQSVYNPRGASPSQRRQTSECSLM